MSPQGPQWHAPGKTQKSAKSKSVPSGVPISFHVTQDRSYHHVPAYPRPMPRETQPRNQPTQYLKKQTSMNTEQISMADFLCRAVLGRGHFGKVNFFIFQGHILIRFSRSSWRNIKHLASCMLLKRSKKLILLRATRYDFYRCIFRIYDINII